MYILLVDTNQYSKTIKNTDHIEQKLWRVVGVGEIIALTGRLRRPCQLQESCRIRETNIIELQHLFH